MLLLCSAAFVTAAPILIISYVVFKCCNKEGNSLKEAVKISNLKAISISGKMFAATLVIVSTFLVHALITNAISGQDIPFLSLVRKIFGFNRSGAWIGGNGGLLLCFMVSSFVVFAISNLMYHYSKDKNVSQDSRYRDTAATVHESNTQLLLNRVEVESEKDGKKNKTIKTSENQLNSQGFDLKSINFACLENLSDSQLEAVIECKDSTETVVENSFGNTNSDNELQAASAKCTKSIVEANSMLKENNIEDIQEIKPTPRPRKGSSQQENLVSQPISNVTVTSMTGASNKDAKEACKGVKVKKMVRDYPLNSQNQSYVG